MSKQLLAVMILMFLSGCISSEKEQPCDVELPSDIRINVRNFICKYHSKLDMLRKVNIDISRAIRVTNYKHSSIDDKYNPLMLTVSVSKFSPNMDKKNITRIAVYTNRTTYVGTQNQMYVFVKNDKLGEKEHKVYYEIKSDVYDLLIFMVKNEIKMFHNSSRELRIAFFSQKNEVIILKYLYSHESPIEKKYRRISVNGHDWYYYYDKWE